MAFLTFMLGGLVATIALSGMPKENRNKILNYFDLSKRNFKM